MKAIILILTAIFLFFSIPLWAVDLQDATLQELVSQRPDLVQDIKAGKSEETVTVSVVKDAQGRVDIWTEERKDVKDVEGVVISKRVDTYSYYPSGEVNEIIQEKYKGKELILKQKVKHYKDGTQPDVSLVAIGALQGHKK